MTEPATEISPEDEYEVLLERIFEVRDELKEEARPDYSFVIESDDEQLGHLLESVPDDVRQDIWLEIPADRQWPVLYALQEETVRHLVRRMPEKHVQALQDSAKAADLLAFADVLPEAMVGAILQAQDQDLVDDLQTALGYEEKQIGRYLNKNIIRIRPYRDVQILKRRIKRLDEDPVAVFVVNDEGEVLGHVPEKVYRKAAADVLMESLYESVTAIDHMADFSDAVRATHVNDTATWYPIMREGKVAGAVSVWTILWEIQDTYLEAALNETPSDEEDLFTPISTAARLRALWLCINLVTAFMASWVIGIFEGAIREVVALAILMPVVASMGGIAGSQTLAVALRGLVLNHLSSANIKLVLIKESKIAAINGCILGLLIAAVVIYWFDSFALGAIIFVAIVVNSLAAATSGTYIPYLLKKMHIDPAISGSVVLTTVTDIVGFVAFLGLGSLLLLGSAG